MNEFLKQIRLATLLFIVSCHTADNSNNQLPKGTFGYDRDFLEKHNDSLVELHTADGRSRMLVSPAYQGRVMTSSAAGDTGLSFGWINYDLIASGEKKSQFNPVGGEERFWLGPEGGQYALYFKAGDSFTINHWQVPPLIDTVSFDLVEATDNNAVFRKEASLTNYSGTVFNFNIERKINLLERDGGSAVLGMPIPEDLSFVGYTTENIIKNTGNVNWTKDKGLMSVWLLGMFTPTPNTQVIIPFKGIPDSRSHITDNYFGEVPPDRLRVKDSVLYFVCDGKFRSKIGISSAIAKPIAAGFDFTNNVLTLVIPEIYPEADYVNSKWEMQSEPYKGDVINAYNDGPLEDGTQMGPFYEIESSSPALALQPGESAAYRQSTLHIQGNYNTLKKLATDLLGVNLEEVK